MRLLEFLDHSTRYLFHGTPLLRLAEVLASDCLLDKTTDAPSINGQVKRGVSLSRTYQFARTYKGQKRSAVLVLDARMIKTTPAAYWGGRVNKYERADEMEEFHIGPIPSLSRYLVSINASISYNDWIKRLVDFGHQEVEGRPDFKGMGISGFPKAAELWNRWSPVRGFGV